MPPVQRFFAVLQGRQALAARCRTSAALELTIVAHQKSERKRGSKGVGVGRVSEGGLMCRAAKRKKLSDVRIGRKVT